MAAAEPADLALDATLFMRPVDTGKAEERIEPVMGSQRHELGVLPPLTPQQDLDDRCFQIVVPDRRGHATEMIECQVVALVERFAALVPEHGVERPTRR